MLRSSRCVMPNDAATSCTRSRIADGSHPAFSQGKASSSATNALKYWVLGFWKTLPTTAAYSSIEEWPERNPYTEHVPVKSPVWNVGISPLSSRVNVVLPQPLWPQSTTNSPWGIVSVTSSSAGDMSADIPLCGADGVPSASRSRVATSADSPVR